MLDNFTNSVHNTTSGLKQMSKGYTPHLGQPHNLNTKGNTYDELKSAIHSEDIVNKTCQFINEYYGIVQNERSVVNKSIIYEFNPFYNNNIRTSILKNKLETIQTNVLSNWELNKKVGGNYEPVELIEFTNLAQSVQLDEDFLNDFSMSAITSDKFIILAKVESEEITFQIRDEYEYFILNDALHIVTFINNGHFIVEREDETTYEQIELKLNQKGEWIDTLLQTVQKETVLSNFYYEVDSAINVVNQASLELTLLYSEVYTSLQKESKISPTNVTVDKRLAPNGYFNFYRNATIEIQKPDSLSVDATDNSEITYNQMNMRSNEFKEMLDIISTELDNILLADQKELGIDPTATAVNANLSEVAKKINLLKKAISNDLNKMLISFFGTDDYLFTVEDYKVDTKDLNDQLDSQEIEKGLNTRYNILKKRYPEWTDEQLMTNYLTIELKLGNPLNAIEEEEARRLGLLKEFQSESSFMINDIDEINGEPEMIEDEVEQ